MPSDFERIKIYDENGENTCFKFLFIKYIFYISYHCKIPKVTGDLFPQKVVGQDEDWNGTQHGEK